MLNRSRRLAWSALLCMGALAFAGSAFAQGPQGNYDPLTLRCVSNGEHFVEIGIKAGASGAPAGFSLQWMTLAAWEANGGAWYSSDDPRLCKMSFSGQPSFSGNHAPLRWELAPNGEVIVKIGDQLYDETGVSGALSDDGTGHFTSPDCQLECGQEYLFRTFAHASRFSGRSCFSFVGLASSNEVGSPFSCNVAPGGPEVVEPGDACSTDSDCGGCTFTQGYWKTHGAGDCHNGNNADAWCVTQLQIGSVVYTKTQLCAILNTPAGGNGLIILGHQLIAAKLNSACSGASCADGTLIAQGDAYIGGKNLLTDSVKPKDLPNGLADALDGFNNGNGCAQHCAGPAFKPAGASQKMRWGTLKSHYR